MTTDTTIEVQAGIDTAVAARQSAPDAAAVYLLLVFRILRTGASEGVRAIAFSSEEELDMTMAVLHEELWTDHRVVLVPMGLEESLVESWRDGGRLARRTALDQITAIAREVVVTEANGRFGYKSSYVPGRWVDTVVGTLLDERIASVNETVK